MLKNCADSYAVVAKVNVSDLESSVAFYTGNLDLTVDPRFVEIDTYRQLNAPGIPRFAVGLNVPEDKKKVGTGHAVTTFVVDNIVDVRQDLINRGVDVTPIQDVGEGVSLAFFDDPDGNRLGIRQNSPRQPGPGQIGWQPS